jgi:hypothetical protein
MPSKTYLILVVLVEIGLIVDKYKIYWEQVMDLNRLRKLAGLDEVLIENELPQIDEAEKIKKGAFHKWLGKPEDEKITQADIDRGLKSDDEHVRKMAQFAANVTESEKPHDSEFPVVKVMDEFEPDNKLNLVNVEFNDDKCAVNTVMTGRDVEEDTSVKVPANVKKHVDKRIAELKHAIEKYDEKGYDDKSVKSTALDVLEKMKEHLNAGNREEFRMAQVLYGTLMSPILDMLPSQLINFLHTGKEKVVHKPS